MEMEVGMEGAEGVKLSMESEFALRRYNDSIDACNDVEELKKLLKGVVRQMLVKDQLVKEMLIQKVMG